VLTTDEVRAIPLFSPLEFQDLQQLARTCEDIHLQTGEFTVCEGGAGALFAVPTGKVEVVELLEGVEHHLGWRLPGTVVSEVPVALGMPSPGALRAAEPSRVMRIDIRHYYTLASASPELAAKSALWRVSESVDCRVSLRSLYIVGQRWDSGYSDLRRFLAREQSSFDWLTPQAPELATRSNETPQGVLHC